MPVSVRSTQSAIDAYAILGEDNVDILKDAFKSIYVKSKYDIPKFNESFDGFFAKKVPKKLKSPVVRLRSDVVRRPICPVKRIRNDVVQRLK